MNRARLYTQRGRGLPLQRLLQMEIHELKRRLDELRRRSMLTPPETIEKQIIDLLIQKKVKVAGVKNYAHRRGLTEITLEQDDPAAQFIKSCDEDLEVLYPKYEAANERYLQGLTWAVFYAAIAVWFPWVMSLTTPYKPAVDFPYL